MKKIINNIFIILFSLLFFIGCSNGEKIEPINFIVANDLHYISPKLLGNGNYFSEPKSNFDGKLVHYSNEITNAFINDVIEKKPKVLILAGDISMNGAKLSHEELVNKLSAVKQAGIDLLVIPGNHDVDNTAVDYSQEELQKAENITSKEFIEIYSKLLPDNLISKDEYSFSYFYKLSEKLYILMLDANTYGKGFVNDQTLQWMGNQLKQANDKGIKTISVTHQNLYAHSELLSFGYTLYNADEVLEIFRKYNVKTNLSGHIHIQSIKNEGIPEIASSSMTIAGVRYGELIYNGKTLIYNAKSVDVNKYVINNGIADKNLLNFNDYSLYYFEEVARIQARNVLKDVNLTVEEKEIMAETYAKINSSYFMGTNINTNEFSEGLLLWENQNNFISNYIDSMIKSEGNKLEFKIKIH